MSKKYMWTLSKHKSNVYVQVFTVFTSVPSPSKISSSLKNSVVSITGDDDPFTKKQRDSIYLSLIFHSFIKNTI